MMRYAKIGIYCPSCHFEAVTPDIFHIQISLFYQFATLLTPIMDNNERIQTSSTYISAFEGFFG